MSTTFSVLMGSIMGLSILLVLYLAIATPSGRLSNILLALGLSTQPFLVFAPPSSTRITVSVVGALLIVASIILALRPVFASRLRRPL